MAGCVAGVGLRRCIARCRVRDDGVYVVAGLVERFGYRRHSQQSIVLDSHGVGEDRSRDGNGFGTKAEEEGFDEGGAGRAMKTWDEQSGLARQ